MVTRAKPPPTIPHRMPAPTRRLLLTLAATLSACTHAPAPLRPIAASGLHSPYTGYSSDHYRDPHSWLCLPGQPNNPCDANLDATELHPDGTLTPSPSPAPTTPP